MTHAIKKSVSRLFWGAVCVHLLSGCYAQQMVLEDDLSTPGTITALSINMPTDQLLARQFQSELLRDLASTRPGVRGISYSPQQPWQLELKLNHLSSVMSAPPAIFGPPAGPERIRVEMSLTGVLRHQGKPHQHINLVERGDAIPTARQSLEQTLLKRLKNRLTQRLQPRYVYR